MRKLRLVVVAIATAASLLTATAARAAPMRLGFSDPVFDPGSSASDRTAYYGKAQASGAKIVRITALWRTIAATKPTGDAGSPTNSAYDFAKLDAAVRAATTGKQQVLLLVASAPDWAEGDNAPSGVQPGTYRPDAAAFGEFMKAVATRYSGGFDPGDGSGALPFVSAFQIWNEPNMSVYVTPQWNKPSGSQPTPESPEIYRDLVNAAYTQIKAASPKALVVEAGLAPYGDPVAGNPRMPPATFTRALLCEKGSRTKVSGVSCPDPVHLDVFSHHPYGVGDPFKRGVWPDDVTLAELPRLTAAWSYAEKTGRVLPKKTNRPRWVTEFGWESKPDPTGLSYTTQATWLGQGLYRLDRAGFTTAFWFHIRDDAPSPSYRLTSQAGIYLRSGKAKPSAAMYRFPVAAIRRPSGKLLAFAIAPKSGTCVAQRQSGSSWKTIASGACTAGVAWKKTVSASSAGRFRVKVGTTTSAAVRSGG